MPYLTERNLKIAAEVVAVAKEAGRSPAQVALQWLMQNPFTCVPIIGGRKTSQIEDNLKCAGFELTPEQFERLDEISRIDLGYLHDFMTSARVRSFAFGGTLEKIDNPGERARRQ